jgi:hypothetical protein
MKLGSLRLIFEKLKYQLLSISVQSELSCSVRQTDGRTGRYGETHRFPYFCERV